MTDSALSAVPDSPDTSAATDVELPAHWHDKARDAVLEVLASRPDLEGPELAQLEIAGDLIHNAETLEEIAKAEDYRSLGAQGQARAHWALPEIRLSRVQGAAILAKLVKVADGPALTASQRGRLAAQARWKGHAGRRGAR